LAKLERLQTLCTCNGISGFEDNVRAAILERITPYVDKVSVDPLGNILAWKKGKQPAKQQVMVCAHMDEVGLLVTHITEEGLLKFTTVGGIDRRVLLGKQVLVGGEIIGVIGGKPIHLLKGDERGDAVSVDSMTIDIGAATKEEAEAVVAPGTPVFFTGDYNDTGDRIFSKALDDRAGCAVLIDLIQGELAYDLHFVFTVQEEVGLRGAKTATYTVEPDAAIVVETTTAADLPGVEGEKRVCNVGEGPVISYMDRATIYDRTYYQLAGAICDKLQIPHQTKHMVAGGNDSGAIHTTKGGVRTIAVSLPCRGLHSPASVIAKEDFHRTERLVGALAAAIAGEELV
jgi:endoglucanase